jgi:AraC-like DNA-binding protein
MSAAMSAMHDDPAHRWTVEQLAAQAGMSRSIFAARFKETVGDSPMEYLTRWRMLLAEEKLASSRDSISGIARSLGYESQSAFTKTFKRVMGRSPRRYSRADTTVISARPHEESTIKIALEAPAGTLLA